MDGNLAGINKHNSLRKDGCPTCGCGLCCTKIRDLGVIRGQTEILKDVNLHIHCGEFTALIGANGSGKSTLLKAILGEISHTGRIEFVDGNNERTGLPSIGYVPQNLDFDHGSSGSVFDVLAAMHCNRPIWFSRSKAMRKNALECLARVQADHLIDRRLGALSGGELQRVLLAFAISPIPELLLLDEPVSEIDMSGLELFYKTVSDLRENYDLSIILVSHDLNLVTRYADKVVFLNNKTVECSGSPEEVFNNRKLTELFRIGS